MKAMRENFFVSVNRRVSKLLSKKQRRQTYKLILLGFLSNIAELTGVASIVPYILLVARPENISENDYISRVYEAFSFESTSTFLITLLIMILLLFIFKALITIYIHYKQVKFSYEVSTDLSKRQARYYLSQDYLFFKERNSHKLVHDARTIPFNFSLGIMIPLMALSSDLLLIGMILVIIAAINIILLLAVALVLLPLIYFSYNSIKNKIRQTGEAQNAIQPQAYTSIHQITKAFPMVKLSGREDYFLNRFIRFQNKSNQLQAINTTYGIIPSKMVEVAAVLGILIVSVYAIFSGKTMENLFLFLSIFATAAYKLMPSLNRVFSNLVLMRRTQFVFDELEQTPHADLHTSAPTPKWKPIHFEKGLHLKNILFQYPGDQKAVLDDLELDLPKGSVTGIAGRSGEGKSTLMYLLMQFLVQQDGQFLVDGKPLTPKERDAWFLTTGFVQQDNFLLDGTIQENIALGIAEDEIDYQKLRNVITQASLEELISQLPEGMNTYVGEGGIKLSEGQKQRIGIARALYKDAEFFVFDEATNALDPKTERIVLESISKLKEAGKTIVIVSHRFSTLRVCDEIFILQQGKLSEPYNYDGFIERFQEEEFVKTN